MVPFDHFSDVSCEEVILICRNSREIGESESIILSSSDSDTSSSLEEGTIEAGIECTLSMGCLDSDICRISDEGSIEISAHSCILRDDDAIGSLRRYGSEVDNFVLIRICPEVRVPRSEIEIPIINLERVSLRLYRLIIDDLVTEDIDSRSYKECERFLSIGDPEIDIEMILHFEDIIHSSKSNGRISIDDISLVGWSLCDDGLTS